MLITQEQRLILGPPGCGKTTRALQIVERELADGVAPNRIAFVSFTKKAVEEAATRASAQLGYTREELTFFRTLHSLCYRLMGLRRSEVLSRQHLSELGMLLGYNFGAKEINIEDGPPLEGAGMGDRLLFIDSLARNRLVTLEDQWHAVNDQDISLPELRRLHDSLRRYKGFHGLLDYTDMLEMVVREQRTVPVDVAVIDEAQDLSRLQWEVCATLFRNAQRVYIAGDDDQAVYRWAGADVEHFLKLEGQREVLAQSYRLPRSIHAIAQQIITRVDHRFDKCWAARDEEGEVLHLPHLESVEFDDGEHLILARNGYLLGSVEAALRKSGQLYLTRYGKSAVDCDHYAAIRAWEKLRKGESISGYDAQRLYACLRLGSGVERGGKARSEFDPDKDYTMEQLRAEHGLRATGIWHDALDGIALGTREYYVSVMRSGNKLNATPRIRLSTIHAAKGGEADNVVLLTDMARRTFMHYQRDPDDEQRVFYVGATRARKRLTLIDAESDYRFRL